VLQQDAEPCISIIGQGDPQGILQGVCLIATADEQADQVLGEGDWVSKASILYIWRLVLFVLGSARIEMDCGGAQKVGDRRESII
jgi:hypothetical protein